MKPRRNSTLSFSACPSNRLGLFTLTISLLAAGSTLAQTFTWDGGDSNTSWGAVNNWNPNGAPTFNTTTDLVFNDLTRATSNSYGANRIVRSITFGANIDATWTTATTSSSVLTFSASSGNASLNVDAGASGNISFSGGTGFTGSQSLTSNLEINQNGSGLLLWNRQTAGGGGFIKNGSGIFEISAPNNNSFTGAVIVNSGRLVMGSTSSTTGDVGFSSGISLVGGTLEFKTSTALNKSITPNLTVSAASTLAYNNTVATDQNLTLQTGNMVLNANLTVQNISSSTAGNNIINVTRSLTGSGNLIVDTYNNVASGAVSFSNGRVQLSGDNTAWTGNLVVAKGTAQFSGNNSFVPASGSVTLGTTGNAIGAALGFNQLTIDANVASNLTVTSGGVRLIRNNAGPGSSNNIILSGNIDLQGNLTLDHAGLGAGKSITVSGAVSGAGGLNVTFLGPHPIADSSVRVTGTKSYIGATNVNSGTLIVDGNISTSVLTTAGSGATIGGDGTTGALTVASGGFVKPGNSAGSLDVAGNYIQAGGYAAEIGGLAAGTQYDQINVAGTVDITGGSLTTIFTGSYSLNDIVFILTNDLDDAITGTFNGFSQGATVTNHDGFDWQISYVADSVGNTFTGGNDIALIAIPEPNVAALLGGLGVLVLLRRRRA